MNMNATPHMIFVDIFCIDIVTYKYTRPQDNSNDYEPNLQSWYGALLPFMIPDRFNLKRLFSNGAAATELAGIGDQLWS